MNAPATGYVSASPARQLGNAVVEGALGWPKEPDPRQSAMPMPANVKVFADSVLLEDKIKDRFEEDPLLRQYMNIAQESMLQRSEP